MGRAFKYVVLGGGTAAGYAAAEFVKFGVGEKELCVISEEEVAPYERPALSKGYLLPEGAVRLPGFHTCVGVGGELQVSRWYKDHGIELALSTRIIAADVKSRKLTTAEGETISYETLIVATGARVLKLEEFGVSGADAENICYLRDLKDANKLVSAMSSSRKGKAVVIGGGYIGMESAAALALNGIQVTMIFPEPHCMARLFTPQIATFYEDYYKRKGIKFIKRTVMSAFERSDSGKVAGVILKDGTRIPADVVVVGVGIKPNISLFENQLTIEKGGIKVNGRMRSSNSNVYAVGDVAAFPLKLFQDVRRLEHVDHSRKSAAHAVRCIMAPEKTGDYDYLPYFYSRVFTLSWQFYGDNVGETVFFGNMAANKFGTFWVHDGNVVGVFLEGGNPDEYAAICRVARLQPAAGDLRTLSRLGLAFAFSVRESAARSEQVVTQSSLVDTVQSSRTLQACLGVAVAAAVVVLAYCWRRKRRRVPVGTLALRGAV